MLTLPVDGAPDRVQSQAAADVDASPSKPCRQLAQFPLPAPFAIKRHARKPPLTG